METGELVRQVNLLFQNYPTLLKDFYNFLPDIGVETPSPRDVSQTLASRQPTTVEEEQVQDAIGYLNAVKTTLGERPGLRPGKARESGRRFGLGALSRVGQGVHDRFLFLLRAWERGDLHIKILKGKVGSMFKSHPELLSGFNMFAPEGHQIFPDAPAAPETPATASAPAGDTVTITLSIEEATVLRDTLMPHASVTRPLQNTPRRLDGTPVFGVESKGIAGIRSAMHARYPADIAIADALENSDFGEYHAKDGVSRAIVSYHILATQVESGLFQTIKTQLSTPQGTEGIWLEKHLTTGAYVVQGRAASMEIVDVGNDDVRKDLRGQKKTVATRAIPAGEVLGVYNGNLLLEGEFQDKYRKSFCTRFEHERYVFRVYFDDITVVIDPWPTAGDAQLMAMNDCRVTPAPTLSREALARQNVEFKCIFLEGFPVVIAVASRPIATRQELLVDYGADYWKRTEMIESSIGVFRSAEFSNIRRKLDDKVPKTLDHHNYPTFE